MAEQAGNPQEVVPRWTRWFVRAFLAAFIVCGLAGIEAWPLTGFRLFSHLRHEQTASWERSAVDADGRERAVNFAGLPDGYRSFVLVVKTFQSSPKDQRDAMCRTWIDGLRRLDPGVRAMRVYEVDRSLLPRHGEYPAAEPTRLLVFTCLEAGASAGGS